MISRLITLLRVFKEKLNVRLRHEPGTKSYLLDIDAVANRTPLSIQGLELYYSSTGELAGSGTASIADEETPVEVSITVDRAGNKHEWSILIPNQPGASSKRRIQILQFVLCQRL